MLDIKVIRNDPESVKKALRNRQMNLDNIIDEIIKIDNLRRSTIAEVETMKAHQNTINKKIPAFKKSGEDISGIMTEMKGLSDKITEGSKIISDLEKKQTEMLLAVPNVPHESTPIGKDETENKEIRKWSNPRNFDFTPQPHWDIGKNLDILDPERAAKVTGARFHFYKGMGARLERAVINFFLDTHTKNGYKEIFPPFMVNEDSMKGTGQLPKFAEDMFKIEGIKYYMAPTAEVPVTNMHRDEVLSARELTLKYCAYSGCFRAEAGSAGRDTRGLIRQHQFNKVELVKLAKPESSYDELESLTADAERVLQLLGLPYRVICLCTGDIGFSSAKTYDIEVWMPSYNRYCEISSCSNFEDFQARRMQIRYKNTPADKAQLVHTLNGSGVAAGRAVAAILENYQNADGSVTVPEVLRSYMGCDIIK